MKQNLIIAGAAALVLSMANAAAVDGVNNQCFTCTQDGDPVHYYCADDNVCYDASTDTCASALLTKGSECATKETFSSDACAVLDTITEDSEQTVNFVLLAQEGCTFTLNPGSYVTFTYTSPAAVFKSTAALEFVTSEAVTTAVKVDATQATNFGIANYDPTTEQTVTAVIFAAKAATLVKSAIVATVGLFLGSTLF